ncbi:RabGAP/TBC domain-containing protein [Tieghemostelium lacteum]|uniref:RabGAP/TBC domain-containing protein n=1 Tax=Tieghemostelium lacteum TaxID=361077 RepID=A0A151Z8G8_TIELA|nr:RabGAP/TBC domain-containing protein [Tieghemostelium lacteum]|eukprot:KYQ90250.1 RabGAP/TBC domain-containing protein [Tieghemostelium lacteum]
MSSKETFRKYGIEIYIDSNDKVILNHKDLKLSIHPFFFKITLSLQSKKYISNSNNNSKKYQRDTHNLIIDDAGIAVPLNQSIFDIFARSRYLSSLEHENLTQFIQVEPSKKHHDQIYIISEDYSNSLSKLIEKQAKLSKFITQDEITSISYQILKALSFLHYNKLTHRNLSIENIKFDKNNIVKLSNYGLYYLSNNGENVSFPIGNLLYLSPESILTEHKGSSNPKSDVWALGCILLHLVLGFCLWQDNNPKIVISRILHLSGLETSQQFNCDTNTFEENLEFKDNSNNNNVEEGDISNLKINQLNNKNMIKFLDSIGKFKQEEISGIGFQSLDSQLQEFIRYCLIPNPIDRPDSETLLDHPFFKGVKDSDPTRDQWLLKPMGKCESLPDDLTSLNIQDILTRDKIKSHYDIFSPSEIYYLWKEILHGDIEKELVLQGFVKPSPSVHKLPLFVPVKRSLTDSSTNLLSDNNIPQINNNNNEDNNIDTPNIIKSKDSILYNNDQICMINIDQILVKLEKSYQSKEQLNYEQLNGTTKIQMETIEMKILLLKEYHKLLYDYQYGDPTQSQPQIIRLARYSIPSLLRGEIWAAILGVNDNDAKQIFYSINLDQKGPNDKQFELDIPRCHQYHPILSSEQGHIQLFRVLKAWSVYNIEYGCYWQGLDSVCATFVVHHFYNESKAFASLKAFVDKYLKILYVPNNFSALSEIMLVYKQLLSYHDPEVSVHLNTIQFEPDLYAIPWFITIFAHILPIDKIETLWDTILLGPSSLPYFIAISIMIQFRQFILTTNSETCLKILPKITSLDVDVCVRDALDKFNHTPLSTTLSKSVPNTDPELWWMQEIPIEKRKRELFPRISIQDLVNNQSNSKILDIRSPESYKQSHYPQSININPKQTKVTPILEQCRNKPIIVIAPSTDEEGIEFCNQLVQWKFKFVSLLNGGMDSIQHSGFDL